MKFFTATMGGKPLDVAVMMAQGFKYQLGIPDGCSAAGSEACRKGWWRCSPGGVWCCMTCCEEDRPSTSWECGGPIIDEAGIMFQAAPHGDVMAYFRSMGTSGPRQTGSGHLVAACRLIVDRRFCGWVDLPEGYL